VGFPYKDACWGPDYFDCWGLIAHVYETQFGINIIHGMTTYKNSEDKVDTLQEYLSDWTKVNMPRIGDGILFLVAGRLPHCGIYVGDNKMLHSIKGTSSCIQRFNTPKWKPRFEGYYRYSSNNS
jgi:cell wall-associated NlpC family hydrolase